MTVFTGDLGRDVYLRPNTQDEQVWADTFTGRYHVPPDDMPTPGTVLDLGANIGLTSAHYAALWPDARVVAVEMAEESAAMIPRNAPGVAVRCYAVSETGGWGSYDPKAGSDSYTFQLGATFGARVESLTLRETVIREFGSGGVDFVKMDVEGAEWGVLAAPSWASLVRHLLVEFHGPDPLERGIAALTQAGYSAEHHARHPQAAFAWH